MRTPIAVVVCLILTGLFQYASPQQSTTRPLVTKTEYDRW